MSNPVTVINFDIRCPAQIIGIVVPIDIWSDSPEAQPAIEDAGGRYGTGRAGEAAERRLQQAEYFIGAGTLNRKSSYLRPNKFRLVGQFTYDAPNLSSLAATDAVETLITWTLHHVYGHPRLPLGKPIPINDVTVRLWQTP